MQQQGEQNTGSSYKWFVPCFKSPHSPLLGCSSQSMLTILAWTPTSSQKYTLLPRGNLAFLWLCYGPRLRINPSGPRGYCRTRFNAGQHKRGRKAEGGWIRAAGDKLSSWTVTPNASWSKILRLKETVNICCPVTVTICTNRDLEIRGFLERSIVVNQPTMQAFPSHQ